MDINEFIKDFADQFDETELEEYPDTHGAPGWIKGIFLLLVSLLLSGMTFYAVGTDLFGKLF